MTYQELLDIVQILNCKSLGVSDQIPDDLKQHIINLVGVAGEVMEVLEMKEKEYKCRHGCTCQNCNYNEGFNDCLDEIKKKLGGNK